MAQPTETFDSYDAGNTNAEDVHDKIYMVTPEKTPALSSGRRFKANQRAHEWLRDALAAPSATNAVIEGDDRTGTAIAAPGRVGNYTQLMDKVAVVSQAQQVSKAIGRSNDLKYAIAKQMTELKRDVEARLVSKLPAVAGNSTTARATAGLGALIYTNALHNGAGATATHATGFATTANTAGTARAFTEALVKTAMQNIYVQSGEMPTMAMMSPAHKTVFSGFTGIATNRYNLKGREQATIIGGADVYVSDFGTLTIVPNYVMVGSTDVFLLNGDHYGVAYLDRFQSKPLAVTGHTDKELCWVECANVVTAERALGKISDLSGG
jgi:hypothetical protein